jgi:type I restriction enzyme S subunit
MSEWKYGVLSDITEIVMGQSPAGENCSNDIIGLPLLNGPTEFTNHSPIPVQFTNDPKRESRKGDILFCVRGSTTGKMNWSDQSYAIGRGIAAIRHKSGIHLNRYIRGIIDYNLDELLQGATGSTFPNVSRTDIGNIQIEIPPLPEQESIAEVLSSLDDKIDLLHRNNKTLEQLAETLFRQWLSKLNERESAILGDYIKVKNGYAFKSNDFRDTGNNGVLKITNISFEQVDIYNTQFVDDKVVTGLSEKFLAKPKSFLIAMTGAEIGKIGIIGKTNKKLYINQRVGMLVDILEHSSLLGYLFLKSAEGQDHIINTCTGSAQENISSVGIESMIIPKSTPEEVISFCKSVNPLFEKIIYNLEQIQQLETLRDTLLPKLMSGVVRVEN